MSILKNPAAWERVLMFAPHPDDESLAAGGLLHRAAKSGAQIRIIFVTNGDNNPWPQRASEFRWKIGDAERARWGERRRHEAISALARLEISEDSARFLNVPDQGVTKLLLAADETFISRIAGEIIEFKPKLLLAPSRDDLHRDHNAFAVLLQLALDQLSVAQKQFVQLDFAVHQKKTSAEPSDFELRLSPEELVAKRDAILCHATQMKLSRRRFLAFASETETFSAKQFQREQQPARIENEVLRLSVNALSHSTDFRKRTLHMVAVGQRGIRSQFSVVLPRRRDVVNLVDAASGAIITQCEFQNADGKCELLIPLPVIAGVERLFTKLEIRFGFYDDAGWREVPLSEANQLSIATVTTNSSPRVCCVVPCYNVAPNCGKILRRVVERVDYVIAIDDGSTDETGAILNEIAAESGGRVRVISFGENRGKGVALLTGFQLALAETQFDLLVTIDSDGQHNPDDLATLAKNWSKCAADLIIGERLELKTMPLRSRFGNSLTSQILRIFYAASPRDTQSGLRGMSRNFVEQIVREIEPRRYETELEILLLALQQHRRISSIVIDTIYFDSNRSSSFRPLLDSARIYSVLVRGLCRKFSQPVNGYPERNVASHDADCALR